MDNEIVLFKNKKDCSGCGACMNVCPKGAISMLEDEHGFMFPHIDNQVCVKCGACQRVCGIQNHHDLTTPSNVYALATKNTDALKKSASGGAFEVMARKTLNSGGVVVGVELAEEDGVLSPRHVVINDEAELYRLQGSKYVQSDTGRIYKEVREIAKTGKNILFSGTPCQIAGLRNFLGKDYPNVLLVDIICHGVPNKRMFKDFLKYRQNKIDAPIKEFYFRDKEYGQGYTTRTVYEKNGKLKSHICKGELFAYICFFSKSLILRDSCYCCPFAQSKRGSDITIGDYWGFSKEFPNSKNVGLNDESGVSCVLANTEKGSSFINEISEQVEKIESAYEKVLKHNKQLNNPTPKSEKREYVLNVYKNEGYSGLEKIYWSKWTKDKIKNHVANVVPAHVKNKIKGILG